MCSKTNQSDENPWDGMISRIHDSDQYWSMDLEFDSFQDHSSRRDSKCMIQHSDDYVRNFQFDFLRMGDSVYKSPYNSDATHCCNGKGSSVSKSKDSGSKTMFVSGVHAARSDSADPYNCAEVEIQQTLASLKAQLKNLKTSFDHAIELKKCTPVHTSQVFMIWLHQKLPATRVQRVDTLSNPPIVQLANRSAIHVKRLVTGQWYVARPLALGKELLAMQLNQIKEHSLILGKCSRLL